MDISVEKLQTFENDNNLIKEYGEGYRIVYYYADGSYSVGEFCRTIEGFMIGLCESYPILDDDDIPKFISTKDLLNRCLYYDKDAVFAALYKTDGTLVDKVEKSKII